MRGGTTTASRAEAASLAAAHRRLHAAGLGLVARGEDDARADDDGPAAQLRLVPLLHGCEERIGIRVQDGRLVPHEHMFSYNSRDAPNPAKMTM